MGLENRTTTTAGSHAEHGGSGTKLVSQPVCCIFHHGVPNVVMWVVVLCSVVFVLGCMAGKVSSGLLTIYRESNITPSKGTAKAAMTIRIGREGGILI